MSDIIRIEEVHDIREATEEQLHALHELSKVLTSEELPGDPPAPFEEWLTEIRTLPSYKRVRCWLAWNGPGGKLAGHSWFTAKYLEDNRHLGEIHVAVRPGDRGKGLATRLLLPAAEAAAADGRTLCEGYVFEGGPGVGFAESLGAKTTILEYHNRLALADVDTVMLEEWVERAKQKAGDYSLFLQEGSWPEEWLPRVADLRNVMNTAPRSESEQDELATPEMIAEWDALADAQGRVRWNYVARHDPTGEWVGLTRMWPSIYRREFANQDDTLVEPAHRNQGLGRWLKAAMLLELMKRRPDTRWVETWNVTTNEAMLNINRALGFKPVLVWQRREIATADLIARLRKRS